MRAVKLGTVVGEETTYAAVITESQRESLARQRGENVKRIQESLIEANLFLYLTCQSVQIVKCQQSQVAE